MKKFLLIVLFLCLLAVGGIGTMVVMSFNPSAYERDVIAYLHKLTGREVSVGGTTSISWNPEPTVTLHNIKLSNIDKSQNPVMLSIEKVTVSIAWKSLLKSPLEIKQIELVKPVLYLERLESNRANFSFPFLLDPNFQLQEVSMLSTPDSATTKIDALLIREGRLNYNNKITGTDTQISNINGTLAVDSYRGPFRFKGTGIQGQGQYALSAEIGAFQGATPVSITANLSENNTRLELNLQGKLTPVGVDKWFDGSVQFNIGRLDTLLTSLNWPLPDLSGGATASGSATVWLTPTSNTLKDFIVRIGEGDGKFAFTGTLNRTISAKKYSYDIDIATDLFPYARWQSYLDLVNWDWISGEKIYPNIRFKVFAKSVPFGTESFQDLTLEGNYTNSILSMDKGTAILPADGKLAFNLIGKSQNQEGSLEWKIQAQLPKPQATLKWLFPDATWLNQPIFTQKGDFTGRVIWQPKLLTVSIDDAKIGETNFSGNIQKTLDDNAAYTAKIAVKNINLDNYTGWKAPAKPVQIGGIPSLIQRSFKQNLFKEGIKASLILDVNAATLFGAPMDRFHIEGSLDNRLLKINRLVALNMGGTDIAVSAILNGIGQPQMKADRVQFGIKTKNLSTFLKKLNLTSSVPLINQATDTSFRVFLKEGNEGAWDMDTSAELSNATIKLKGNLTIGESNSLHNMAFEIAHPNFQTFMKSLEPSFAFLPKLDGIFKTTGTISGNKEHFDFKDTSVAIGLQKLSGSLSFDNHQIKMLTADLMAPALDLERFTSDVNPLYSEINGLSKKALNLSVLNNWSWDIKLNASQLIYKDINIRQAVAQTTLQNKELNLTQLTGISGTSDKSPVNITAKLDWNTTPTLTTNFDIKNIPLRSDFMTLPELVIGGGNLSISGDLKARGESPAAFMSTLNGQGTLALQGGQMIGVDAEKMIPIITRAIQRSETAQVIEPEFKRVLNSGKTVLGTLSGDYTISNGTVRMMDLTLETANTIANPTQIVWDIPKRTLDISIPVLLKPLNSLPPFILGISVTPAQSLYTPNYTDLLGVLSNRSQTILANDLRQKEEAAQAASLQKRADRLEESKRLTEQARQAVTHMNQKIMEFPFEKGNRLLASAKDTLMLLNQLAVKEDPTDAQLLQQIEYARTILLKADEFNQTLMQETLFTAQKQMDIFRKKGKQMADQLLAWAKAYPDIITLQKLSAIAEQNRQVIEQSAAALNQQPSMKVANEILATCADALVKIEQAYQRAASFDLSGVPNQVAGEVPQQPHAIRGSFKRSR